MSRITQSAFFHRKDAKDAKKNKKILLAVVRHWSAMPGRFKCALNKKGKVSLEKGPFPLLAPRPGLEPGTHRLHCPLCFHKEWTISSSHTRDVGRCWGLLMGVSSPSLCTFPATCSALRRAWLRITATRMCCGFPDFTRFSTTCYQIALQVVQSRVNLCVTIVADQDALVQFCANPFPRPGIAFCADPEFFVARMVE